MSEAMRMWVEISFNITYLVVVWGIVIAMYLRQSSVAVQDRGIAPRIMWAFALLALGDSGHVGLRVLAYGLGGLEARPVVFGMPLSLVGVGALSTAITVTFFYMLMVDVWRLRFNQHLGWFGWLLLAAGVVRLGVMAFPQNRWDLVVAPYGWSLARNSFLTVQGLGVMALILREASKASDNAFRWIGIMIAISFVCYAPVILWVQWAPILGMLMIPKTCAYVGIALIAYRDMYGKQLRRQLTEIASHGKGNGREGRGHISD